MTVPCLIIFILSTLNRQSIPPWWWWHMLNHWIKQSMVIRDIRVYWYWMCQVKPRLFIFNFVLLVKQCLKWFWIKILIVHVSFLWAQLACCHLSWQDIQREYGWQTNFHCWIINYSNHCDTIMKPQHDKNMQMYHVVALEMCLPWNMMSMHAMSCFKYFT